MTPETPNPDTTPKVPESAKTPETPETPKTPSHVNTATEWLTSQGVRAPQPGSQISASSSRPLTAKSHSTNEEGTDVDAAREEPIIPAQSEGAVERVPAPAE